MDVPGIVKRIKKIQDDKQMSNQAFADVLNSSSASLSHMYSGRNKPSLQIILAVSEAFGVSADYLLYGRAYNDKRTPTPPSGDEKRLSSGNGGEPASFSPKAVEDDNVFESEETPKKINSTLQNKIVDSIIIIYEDGTFTTHKPSH